MKKVLKFAMIFCVVGTCFFLVSLLSSFQDVTKDEITITKKFEVTSNVTNVLKQEYTSTITGEIKNNSDKDINDLTFTFNVKTNTLNHTGTITSPVISVKANSTQTIRFTVNTEENFETIVSSRSNHDKTITIEGDKSNNRTYIVLIVLFSIGLVTSIIYYFRYKNEHPEPVHVTTPVHATTYQYQRPAQNNNSEIQNLKNEIEKEKLKNEIKELENEKLTNTINDLKKEKFVVCPYCDSKNDANNKHCENCGAAL